MKYWSSQILFRLWDSLLQFKVMVLTLSSGLVLPFLEGWVSSSFIIADSRCSLGQIWSIHYLLIASQLHCFQDDEHWKYWDISSLRTYEDIEVVVFHASYLHTTVIQGRHVCKLCASIYARTTKNWGMTRNTSRLSAVVQFYTFVVRSVLFLRTTFYSTNAKNEKVWSLNQSQFGLHFLKL
jgi:hypothetical protein